MVALAIARFTSVWAGPVLPNIGGVPNNGGGGFHAKDTMAKSLASMFLLKEGNVPSAQSALNVFAAVANKNLQNQAGVLSSNGQDGQASVLGGLITYPTTTLPEKLAGLAPNFTQILGASHPDLSYFTDPSQNQFGDFFDFLTRDGTSLGSVSGPNFINSAPCLIGTAVDGVAVAPSAISIVPQLISVNPAGE